MTNAVNMYSGLPGAASMGLDSLYQAPAPAWATQPTSPTAGFNNTGGYDAGMTPQQQATLMSMMQSQAAYDPYYQGQSSGSSLLPWIFTAGVTAFVGGIFKSGKFGTMVADQMIKYGSKLRAHHNPTIAAKAKTFLGKIGSKLSGFVPGPIKTLARGTANTTQLAVGVIPGKNVPKIFKYGLMAPVLGTYAYGLSPGVQNFADPLIDKGMQTYLPNYLPESMTVRNTIKSLGESAKNGAASAFGSVTQYGKSLLPAAPAAGALNQPTDIKGKTTVDKSEPINT
ncbi:MAG: hypothetical protein KTR14_11015 [Vampirovibrio sp.]|nr:hypothetical protein [Vampirovibrio sp.]